MNKAKEIAERRALEKEMSELGKVDLDAPRGTRGSRKPSASVPRPRKSSQVAIEDANEDEDDDGGQTTKIKKRRMVVPESSPPGSPREADGHSGEEVLFPL
jgi:hypothetical protein